MAPTEPGATPGVRPRRRTAREERRAAVGTAPVVVASVGRRRRRVDGVEISVHRAAARARERSPPNRRSRPIPSPPDDPARPRRLDLLPDLERTSDPAATPGRVRPASPAVAHRG